MGKLPVEKKSVREIFEQRNDIEDTYAIVTFAIRFFFSSIREYAVQYYVGINIVMVRCSIYLTLSYVTNFHPIVLFNPCKYLFLRAEKKAGTNFSTYSICLNIPTRTYCAKRKTKMLFMTCLYVVYIMVRENRHHKLI